MGKIERTKEKEEVEDKVTFSKITRRMTVLTLHVFLCVCEKKSNMCIFPNGDSCRWASEKREGWRVKEQDG